MAENTLLNYFFESGGAQKASQFGLNRKSRSKRMREIISILHKHQFLNQLTPEEFRAVFEELGPSFVKIGQTLSTRSEILPKAYCEELTKLQTECDPLPFEQILVALRAIYGEEYGQIFKSVDPKPLGSASLAQVHKAKLVTGETVAVKIQRPGVKFTMAQDIDIMRGLARKMSRFIKGDAMIDPIGIVEEMWDTFVEETDFRREAENLQTFKELNKDCVFIDSPYVYTEYSGEYVLVMEYIEGINISHSDELLAAGYDLAEIGEKLLDNYATQVLDHGFFHADPHPGNIIIREGKIVYIDLGIMGRLTPAERAGFARIIHAVSVQSSSELADALISFAVSRGSGQVDHAKLLADTDNILRTYASCDVSDLDIGAFLNDVLVVTRASKCQMPSTITNVARGIVTVEGTVAPYIPNESIVGIINGHIMRSTDPVEQAKDTLVDAALVMRRAAEGLSSAAEYSGEALRMMTRGQLKMNMEVLGSEAPLLRLSKIVNRMTMGILAAGLFMGSSLFATTGLGPEILDVPAVSFFGFVGTFVLSAWIVIDIWRRK